MSGLLQRSITIPTSSPIPAARNRLIATFQPAIRDSFQKVINAIQPLFQQRAYAPLLFLRPGADSPPSTPLRAVTINDESDFSAFVLARPLVLPGERRGLTEQEIDAFISLCSEVSISLDDIDKPRGWFARKRSTSAIVQKPSLPLFDKTRDQAVNLAWQYSSFLGNLPNYRRLVRIAVEETEAHPQELEDFVEFAGFNPRPVSPGLWYEDPLCATLQLHGEVAWFSLPVIARTPEPETAYQNLQDAAKRLAMEFGGHVVDDSQNDQVIRGWTNLLAKVRLQPGDEEARELFPFTI